MQSDFDRWHNSCTSEHTSHRGHNIPEPSPSSKQEDKPIKGDDASQGDDGPGRTYGPIPSGPGDIGCGDANYTVVLRTPYAAHQALGAALPNLATQLDLLEGCRYRSTLRAEPPSAILLIGEPMAFNYRY